MSYLQHPWRAALWGGLGGALAILVIQAFAAGVHQPLLIAPFGASCVVLFLAPQSELARVRNIVGGYLIGTFVGLALSYLAGDSWWAPAMAVGLTMALMSLTRTVHPAAAAQPIVILLAKPEWTFVLMPTLVGVGLLVASSWAYHRGLLHWLGLRKI